jgi:hypothetical protein
MNTRQKWLALALLATLAAAFWPERQEPADNVVQAVKRTQGETGQVRVAEPAGAAEQGKAAAEIRLAGMKADLFPRQSWVPPPPPPKPYVPPPPKPPPLPFTYLGRWMDGGTETVFLNQGGQAVPVKAGQVLAGIWRVDEITHSAVVFTYLPLDMQSTLGITP